MGKKECECEEEGYFNSGFKGILSHVDRINGIPSKVKRCDICKTYKSDEEAEQKLKELLKVA